MPNFSAAINCAAAFRSSIFEAKLESENAPSERPRPVKSKRNTANPARARPAAMREAASVSLEQVKQCAKIAAPR